MGRWSSGSDWQALLEQLVGWASVTGTPAEAVFPEQLQALLRTLPYFQQHPHHLSLYPTGDGRHLLTALVRPPGPPRPETVVLLSHFDVVGVDDYGPLASLAFDPARLTRHLAAHRDEWDGAARADLETGAFLFGRGVMDMKGGLAAHLALVAEAAEAAWSGNLLCLSVPDEEANSVGMRRALDALAHIAARERLDYRLVINSEPIFPRFPGDATPYVYTGSIGKMLAGLYCVGQATHVGEPLAGLNANTVAAALTAALEWHDELVQRLGDEKTPPPTNLGLQGLSSRYSVQIPFRAVTLTNVLLFDEPLNSVLERMMAVARSAVADLLARYRRAVTTLGPAQGTPPMADVRLLTYEDLHRRAVAQAGPTAVAELVRNALSDAAGDERARGIRVVERLAALCPDLAPMVVLFLAVPYYPAVNSADHPRVARVLARVNHTLQAQGLAALVPQAYYPGLSDLSFVGQRASASTRETVARLMPGWGRLYDLPDRDSILADVPGINLGPVGFDAHRVTERINTAYVPKVLLPALRAAVAEALRPEEPEAPAPHPPDGPDPIARPNPAG